MKRPMLVCSITSVIICSMLIIFDRAFVVIPLLSALVLFLFIVKRKLFKSSIIVPTVCVVSLICSLSFFIVNNTKITPVLKLNDTTQDIYGKIITTPQHTDTGYHFVIEAERIGSEKVKATVDITLPDTQSHKLYDYVCINSANLYIPTKADGSFDFSQVADGTLLRAKADNSSFLWESNKTPYYHILSFKSLVCERADAYMSTDAGGLFKGMLFGDKSDLSSATEKSFRASGISHLLAVSGLHTSLWCGLILALLAFFKTPAKAGNAICICFLILFCILSAFTPSVIRASVMTAAVLSAPFFKRTPDSINSLGLAVVVLLISNPYIVANISFQLSVAATLGVLVANRFSPALLQLKKKIPFPRIANTAHTILSSLLISCFAGVFTLPICAYHFGVVSLAAPLSNLLCIQLAFYGLISGAVSILLSFIKLPVLSSVTAVLFNFTEFLLNLLNTIASSISSIKLCSTPISKQTLVVYIFILCIVAAISYLTYRKSKKKYIIKTAAVICAAATLFTILTPFTPITRVNSITVLKVDSGIHILLKSGTHYAFIENSNSKLTSTGKKALPQASCESLDYYIVSHIGKKAAYNLSYIYSVHSPQNIILSSASQKSANSFQTAIPSNARIADNITFSLNNEITAEIVDTGSTKYAIIKCGTNIAYIHLYGKANHTDLIKQNKCNIAVFNGVPTKPPQVYTQTVAVSTNEAASTAALQNISYLCGELYTTTKHNDITIYL